MDLLSYIMGKKHGVEGGGQVSAPLNVVQYKAGGNYESLVDGAYLISDKVPTISELEGGFLWYYINANGIEGASGHRLSVETGTLVELAPGMATGVMWDNQNAIVIANEKAVSAGIMPGQGIFVIVEMFPPDTTVDELLLTWDA